MILDYLHYSLYILIIATHGFVKNFFNLFILDYLHYSLYNLITYNSVTLGLLTISLIFLKNTIPIEYDFWVLGIIIYQFHL